LKIILPVEEFAEHLGLTRMNPGFQDERFLEGSAIFFAGLALAGYLEHLTPRRCVLLGESELGYLGSLGPDLARSSVEQFLEVDLGCILVTSRRWVPDWFLALASARGIGIYYSKEIEPQSLQPRVGEYLRDCLAPRETMHGVMMDVSGVGVLLTGASGIGKSECALELIKRGHRLISDDAVLLKRLSDDFLIAEAPDGFKHAMELRGVGLVDIRALFGMGAVSERKEVSLVVRLERRNPDVIYDRLGIEPRSCEVVGVSIPYLVIPVVEAKNLSILVEVAAMNQHLRSLGIHSAKNFTENLERRLMEKMSQKA
jgi:HPr kinase/phosphorylase